MTELLTAQQMRAIERAAIENGSVTGLELMERAGRGVVDAIFEEWPELAKTSHRAVVLCGPGNNGGDGFVVARLLKEWGWEVEVFLYGDPDKLPPDARVNYDRWVALGEVEDLSYRHLKDCSDADIYVDAVFGTGMSRPIEGDLGRAMMYLAGSGGDGPFFQPRMVAVDVPSGLCADSGKILGALPEEWAPACPYAALTVTFHALKVGHLQNAKHCGKPKVADIGLPLSEAPASLRSRPAPHVANSVQLIDAITAELEKAAGHKFSHGHALILSGGPGQTGAARLAARGALRMGAGLVTLGVPPAAQQEAASQLTAIMLARVPDADALAERLKDGRINALCLGPGLGLTEREARLIKAALSSKRPTVLDADALTLIARDPDLFGALHDTCVLTPHAGEFARLFPDIAEKLAETPTRGPAYSKVDAARDAAKRAGCTVLFKGPDTVIAAPDGRCSINASVYDRAAPWLATAGSGDVLAGFITGLLARGFNTHHAASTGAWLHTECALSFGPGLIAEDLPEELPKVLRHLGV